MWESVTQGGRGCKLVPGNVAVQPSLLKIGLQFLICIGPVSGLRLLHKLPASLRLSGFVGVSEVCSQCSVGHIANRVKSDTFSYCPKCPSIHSNWRQAIIPMKCLRLFFYFWWGETLTFQILTFKKLSSYLHFMGENLVVLISNSQHGPFT